MIEKKYTYDVGSTEIIPPMENGMKYAGKLLSLFEVSSGLNIKVTNVIFPETWGRTAEEAEFKMEQQIDRWAQKQKAAA